MIVMVEIEGARVIVADVHSITEKSKPSMFKEEGRKVVNLLNEAGDVLLDGEDIDLGNTKLTVLPNAERSAEND